MKASTLQTAFVTVLSLFCLRNDLEKRLFLCWHTFWFQKLLLFPLLFLPFGEPSNAYSLIDFMCRKIWSISGFKVCFLLLLNDRLLSAIAFSSTSPTDLLTGAVTAAASIVSLFISQSWTQKSVLSSWRLDSAQEELNSLVWDPEPPGGMSQSETCRMRAGPCLSPGLLLLMDDETWSPLPRWVLKTLIISLNSGFSECHGQSCALCQGHSCWACRGKVWQINSLGKITRKIQFQIIWMMNLSTMS